MPKSTYAVTLKKLELRSKALAANSGDLPHMEIPRAQLDTMTAELKDLTVQQASLTANKQETSKQIADLVRKARQMLNFLDVGVKQHYGTEAEKLVEFGVQPFRSAPRVRLVGPDGEPVKKKPVQPVSQTPAPNP
jgi:hypothetical protein